MTSLEVFMKDFLQKTTNYLIRSITCHMFKVLTDFLNCQVFSLEVALYQCWFFLEKNGIIDKFWFIQRSSLIIKKIESINIFFLKISCFDLLILEEEGEIKVGHSPMLLNSEKLWYRIPVFFDQGK